MLDLKPLVARLVDDVLRAIAEATRDELKGARAVRSAASKPARSSRRARRQAVPPRRPPGASRPGLPVDPHAGADSAVEPPSSDAITNPEDLLSAKGPSPVLEVAAPS